MVAATPASSRRASGVLHAPLSLLRPPPIPPISLDVDTNLGGGSSRRPRANADISAVDLSAALLHAPKNVLLVSEAGTGGGGVRADSSAASTSTAHSNRDYPMTPPQRSGIVTDARMSSRPSSASTALGLRSSGARSGGALSTSGARQRLAASAIATSATKLKPNAWAAKPGISGRLLVNDDSDSGSGSLRVFSERMSFSNSRPHVKTRWDPSDEASQYFGFGSRACETDGGEDNVLELHGASWDDIERALFLGKDNTAASIGAPFSTLPSFASLRVLSLSNCGLSPDLVLRLPALPCLEACDFSRNVLTGIGRVPEDITASHLTSLLSSDVAASPGAPDAAAIGLRWLRFAPRLKALSLSHCELDAVPSLVWLARPGCALERLDLSSNRIVAPEGLNVVSSTLSVLDLGSNSIASFGFEGVRLLGSLSHLAHLVLHSNPVVSTATSPSAYRASVINLIPSLLSLDGVETPLSVVRTRQAQTETALRPTETALRARLRREQSAADEARKREALRLSSVSAMPHKYRAGPKKDEPEQGPSRPPWRPNSNDTPLTASFSSFSTSSSSSSAQPFLLPAKSATPAEASRLQRLRMNTLSRPTRRHVPPTPLNAAEGESRESPTKSPRSPRLSARPSRRTAPVALLAQEGTILSALAPLDDDVQATTSFEPEEGEGVASFAERQENLTLSLLSATKAILLSVEPWRVEVFGGGAVDAAAQTAARVVATILTRLRNIMGVNLGGCRLEELAERASREPAPSPRGLLGAEVQRELAASSAVGLSEGESSALATVVTARKALELVSHVLLSHAAITRRLVSAGASHEELHERVAKVKSDIDDVCRDLSVSACGKLSEAFLAARK